MPTINPIRTQKDNSFADLLAADVVGASAALGTDYWLQKDAFKNADRFIPSLQECSSQLAKNGIDSEELNGLVKYLSDKKVSNYSLFSSAIKGAAVAGLLFLGYHLVKNTAGRKDKDFEGKTATAAGIGAIGGGLANYFSQKSILNSLSSIRNNVQNMLIATVTEGNNDSYKFIEPLEKSFKNITLGIGNGKAIKSAIAHGALRGAAYTGSAYVLYRGIKALFNRKPRPQVQIIELPDEVAKELFKTRKSDKTRTKASEIVIDV